MPNAMKIRRQTVEHPVGILKAWMGATHFLVVSVNEVEIRGGVGAAIGQAA